MHFLLLLPSVKIYVFRMGRLTRLAAKGKGDGKGAPPPPAGDGTKKVEADMVIFVSYSFGPSKSMAPFAFCSELLLPHFVMCSVCRRTKWTRRWRVCARTSTPCELGGQMWRCWTALWRDSAASCDQPAAARATSRLFSGLDGAGGLFRCDDPFEENGQHLNT